MKRNGSRMRRKQLSKAPINAKLDFASLGDISMPIRFHRSAFSLAAIYILALICFCNACFFCGASNKQTVPDSIKSGEPASIELEFRTHGDCSPAAAIVNDVACYYRLAGEEAYKVIPLTPTIIQDQGNHMSYRFNIPAYLSGVKGEIEYYIEMKERDMKKRIEGIKKIKIE